VPRERLRLLIKIEWYNQNQIELRLGVRITDINADEKTVTGDDCSVTPFDKLLLCEKKRQ
jgi:NAD(P)H-nitrite reductase large subunit